MPAKPVVVGRVLRCNYKLQGSDSLVKNIYQTIAALRLYPRGAFFYRTAVALRLLLMEEGIFNAIYSQYVKKNPSNNLTDFFY